MSAPTADVVHHLYSNGPAQDLVPYRGVTPGPDSVTGDWHTGHGRDLQLECVGFGLPCCITCLSPEALSGWTPLIMEESFDGEEPVWSDEDPA
ncbi:hypothetical protein OG911_31200 [Streptomyces sp. NBC_00208]|uniref:hypothetical protein n=1 Tax=Streptomyces sp. NBC_00208 TaxID=2975681 RepID=UPI002E2B2216|nr:hypothetical protein [Streptomyces sp. NBC_00208]